MFPRSLRLRIWIRRDGMWALQALAAVFLIAAYAWRFLIPESWPWMPYVGLFCSAFLSIYSLLFWCVAEGQAFDETHRA